MKPSWKKAPDWARYLAQDGDGSWWWYEDRPHVAKDGAKLVHVRSQRRTRHFMASETGAMRIERRPRKLNGALIATVIAAAAILLAAAWLNLAAAGASDLLPVADGPCNQWQCAVDKVIDWCGDNGQCLFAAGVVI